MKNPRVRFTAFVPLLAVALLFLLSLPTPSSAITLTGANGKAVEFHLIKEATPKGLTAQLVADGPVIGVTWDKLDLKALERDQKLIFAAYERAIAGETIALNLDDAMTGAPAAAVGAAPKGEPKDSARYPGWLDTRVGKIEFMLQMPLSKPRGILLISLDDFGHSFRYLDGNPDRGKGPWAEFLTKYDFALLSYNVESASEAGDPTKIDEFAFADKGSGRALESALGNFATKLKQPDLIELPMAIFGADRTGAAFAYSYIHYKPERVLAAVLSKGAFYDSAPRPETSKVPILFIWGEYCNKHERWGSENHAETLLAKAAPLKPNWTNGREFRGGSEMNAGIEYFAKQYLIEMIKMRLPEKKSSNTGAPPPAEAAAEGTKPDGAKTEDAAPSEATKEEAKFDPVDRTRGYRGNIETGEVFKITDPEAALGEEETFIPNDGVSNLWKKFVMGELEAPVPGPPN
jgi:hypothetical protein